MGEEDSVIREDCNQNTVEENLSKLSFDSIDTSSESLDLPQVFQVKYLGSQDARGLWGIKHTRKPVDKMVEAAKSLPSGMSLPILKIVVSDEKVTFSSLNRKNENTNIHKVYSIKDISYGVQDIVYTRIFSMIVVRDTDNIRRMTPFECHGFVCESKYQAKQLTYALANAFKIYTDRSKINDKKPTKKTMELQEENTTKIGIDIICNT